jgi:hypothetical protein
VKVSVKLWSSADETGGVLLGYQDETHYIRFVSSATCWSIVHAYGTGSRILTSGGACIAPAQTPYGLDHSEGHRFVFEARRGVLTGWIDDEVMGTVDVGLASEGGVLSEGKVGLFSMHLPDANFDDFVVESL